VPPFPAHGAHGPVAAAIYKPSWDPLVDLPGLTWLLHPDDATDVISGEINSLVCRKSGVTFTANAAANRMALNTSERTGHNVAASVTTINEDFLVGNDSGIAAVTGSFYVFNFRRSTTTAAATHECIEHSTNTTYGLTGVDGWQIRRTNNTNHQLQRADNGAGSTWDIAWTNDTVWNLLMWQFDDSSQTAELFVNNISIGTDTATTRNCTGMTHVLWGAGLAYHSVSGVGTGVLSSTDRTELRTWILANA